MKLLQELGQLDRSNRGGEFISLVKHIALARGNAHEAAAIAEARRAPERVRQLLTKAAVEAADTTTGEWGAQLGSGYNLMTAGFLDLLRTTSAFFAMLDGGLIRVPLRTRLGTIASGATAGEVAPGAAIPMSSMSLTAGTLERHKVGGMFVGTKELLEGAGGEALLSRSLRAAVSEAADRLFISLISAGVVATAATAAPMTDLRAMLGSVNPSDQSRLFWIADADAAVRLSTFVVGNLRMFPEVSPTGRSTLLGAPFIVSAGMGQGSPHTSLALVDASSIMAGSEGVAVEASKHAAVQMATDPTMASRSAAGPVAANPVSMWQTDSLAVRATLFLGAEPVRTNAVAILENAAW